MSNAALVDAVHDVVRELETSGVTSFTVEKLQAHDLRLVAVRAIDIDQALFELQRQGARVHPRVLGTNGCHCWAFG